MERKLLIAAAITAALALPAQGQAQGMPPRSHHDSHGDRFARGFRDGQGTGVCENGDHGRHGGTVVCDGFAYADGQWALYNNRSWAPNSYNDWWNDRPDRAYPRWVQEQHMRGTCTPDRMWWSGSGWHC